MENVSAVHSTVIYTLRHILFDMSYVSQIRRSQFQQSKSHGFKSTGPVSNLAKTSSMCFVISLSSSKNAIYCLFVISNHKPHLSILLQSFLEMLHSSVILYCCQNPPFMGLWLSFAWENAVKCKSMGSLFFTNFHVIKFTGKIENRENETDILHAPLHCVWNLPLCSAQNCHFSVVNDKNMNVEVEEINRYQAGIS